jgi:hypothetical protein
MAQPETMLQRGILVASGRGGWSAMGRDGRHLDYRASAQIPVARLRRRYPAAPPVS